jgi:DNA-binding transcriptional ArsR family regulator
MVEQVNNLDGIFESLSNPTRRDILDRVSEHSMSIGDIAKRYKISFAGIAKHLEILERTGLVFKTRQGKKQIVTIDPKMLVAASDYLESYRQLFEGRLDNLDEYLKSINKKG